MEWLAVGALILAAAATGYAFAQHKHIAHLEHTVAFERGQGGSTAPSGAQRKQIRNGAFQDAPA